MLGVAVPSLLRCARLSLSTMEYLVGIFAFVTFARPCSAGGVIDRRGRRWSFQASLLGTGIFGGLTALVGATWQFVLVRLHRRDVVRADRAGGEHDGGGGGTRGAGAAC